MRRSRRYVRHSVLCQRTGGRLAKRENEPTYRSRGKRKSALNLEVLSRSFAPVRDFLVFDDLPLIETAEAGSFDRRSHNVNAADFCKEACRETRGIIQEMTDKFGLS